MCIRDRLFRYYERYGTFAKAEDMLFHMLNDYPEATDIKTSGLQFFERLLTREDGVLETGGLPRNEVEEGLEQLKASVRTRGQVVNVTRYFRNRD